MQRVPENADQLNPKVFKNQSNQSSGCTVLKSIFKASAVRFEAFFEIL